MKYNSARVESHPPGYVWAKFARHFSLPGSSSLLLRPDPNIQIAMTRMTMPNGFPGPPPRIPPEKASQVPTSRLLSSD
jgi:hypothetical protein